MPEVDLVQVHRQDLVLRVPLLDLDREEDLVDFPGERLLRRQEDQLRELLRDGGGALLEAAGGEVAQRGSADADDVDAAVVVEARVLGREDRLDEDVGNLAARDTRNRRSIANRATIVPSAPRISVTMSGR